MQVFQRMQYQNYRYGDTSKVPDFEIKESLKLSFKEIDEIAREPEMSQVNINALKEANIRYMDLLSHDSTVIYYMKGYNAKLTAPIRALEGIVTPLKREGITSFAIDRYAMASLSGTTERQSKLLMKVALDVKELSHILVYEQELG